MLKDSPFYRKYLFRLIILIVMVYNTGIFSYLFNEYQTSQENSISRDETVRLSQAMNQLLEDRKSSINRRVAKGFGYRAEDYVRDIKFFEVYQADNKIYNTYPFIELQKKFLSANKNNSQSFLEVRKIAQSLEENKEQAAQNTLKLFFLWLWSLYLCNLLPVAILYFLGHIENQFDKKDFPIPNPFYFALAVLAHPYILGRNVWLWSRSKSREIYFEARLRQTKSKLFSCLSTEEKRLIKNFAVSKIGIKQWQNFFTSKSLSYHHTIVLALLVVIVMSIVPKTGEANKSQVCSKTVIECAGHLARMDIDENSSKTKGQVSDIVCIVTSSLLDAILDFQLFVFQEKKLKLNEPVYKILCIPIFQRLVFLV